MMSILSKMKEKGFIGTIVAGVYFMNTLLNRLLFNICKLFPLRKKVIVFESESDFTDNGYALYSYMLAHDYMKKYKAVWLVDNLKEFRDVSYENTLFCHKQDIYLSIKRSYYLATAKYYLFDHNLVIGKYKRRKGQTTVYISHGSGFKMAKGSMGCDLNKYLDWHIVTGPVAADYESYYWNNRMEGLKDFGVPRNDLLYNDMTEVKKKIDAAFHFSDYKKVILWMPTFRKSRNAEISEEYVNTETSLPLLETMQSLNDFNEFLAKNNALMILKVHHLSADLPIYKETYSNILILHNENIAQLGIQLYEFVACTDILLTDYSSISIDYLLLDRPMVFTLDDYEQYAASRGLYPDNARDYMPGYHVYSIDELKQAFTELFRDEDNYKEQRKKTRAEYHTYCDGNAGQRLIDFLGIK
ncbi:MAG: CDP-glycerol glycerophosphotransferase family protein [Lachnospiraceae bacterium]|nr:CDP-glycerol glycerophosphotransferase family protein [Lachnospiraceae bacterium]